MNIYFTYLQYFYIICLSFFPYYTVIGWSLSLLRFFCCFFYTLFVLVHLKFFYYKINNKSNQLFCYIHCLFLIFCNNNCGSGAAINWFIKTDCKEFVVRHLIEQFNRYYRILLLIQVCNFFISVHLIISVSFSIIFIIFFFYKKLLHKLSFSITFCCVVLYKELWKIISLWKCWILYCEHWKTHTNYYLWNIIENEKIIS